MDKENAPRRKAILPAGGAHYPFIVTKKMGECQGIIMEICVLYKGGAGILANFAA